MEDAADNMPFKEIWGDVSISYFLRYLKRGEFMKTWLKTVVLVFAFLSFSRPVFGDEPPSWKDFEVKSANGRFVAKVAASPGTRNYRLSIYAAGDTGVMWSCGYDYDGYPGGMLSDDGIAFVTVNPWYKDDAPVVTVYHNGRKTAALRGADFHIERSALKQAASHQLWLKDDGEAYRFSRDSGGRLTLKIETIDGKSHILTTETGKLFN
jgi:hypothetical protein